MEIVEIASYCLGCPLPRCQGACPCGNQIRDIISLVKQGKEAEAAALLYSTNPFPELTSLLCDHSRQCRGNCVRGIRGEPVDFPAIEAYLASKFPFPFKKGKPNGVRVAIVGAGPAGLTAAAFLAEKGIDVEVYEKESAIGGAALTGIPWFRFDKRLLSAIQPRLEAQGIHFHFEHEISMKSIDDLARDFDEIILAIGASEENDLGLAPSPYILHALPFLRDYNLKDNHDPIPDANHIVVMGGGNVAMDASRSLAKLGKKVTLIYRRDEASMPAQKKEIQEAKDEGVEFIPLTNLVEPLFGGERLVGLKLVKMELGEKDASGRPSFHAIEGSEFEFACDAFMMAIGEKSCVADLFKGEVQIHHVGDCRYGAKNIAAAIKDGREVTQAIIAKYCK